MRNYLSCLSQGPGNPARQTIRDHEYAGCLAQCDGVSAIQGRKAFKPEEDIKPKQSPARTTSWVDHGA